MVEYDFRIGVITKLRDADACRDWPLVGTSHEQIVCVDASVCFLLKLWCCLSMNLVTPSSMVKKGIKIIINCFNRYMAFSFRYAYSGYDD